MGIEFVRYLRYFANSGQEEKLMPASSLVRVCLITEPDPFQSVGWLHCAIGIAMPSLLFSREGSFVLFE